MSAESAKDEKGIRKEERKMKKKIITTILLTAAMTLTVAGCGSNKKSEGKEASEELTGSISLAGSTSMEKLCEALSESFMTKCPDITVTTQYTGSGAGLESLASKSIDIGNASRHLSEEEVNGGAQENVVAIDGIAVITDKENSIANISAGDLAKVYSGEITNWKDLGGDDEEIVVIGREAGSGTRDAFEELLGVADKCKYAQELDSTGAALAKVQMTPGAIGYVSLDVVNDQVNELALDGVEPTEENILKESYLLSRPFVMATNGKVEEQNQLIQTWFDYINSGEGQEVIRTAGLILPTK